MLVNLSIVSITKLAIHNYLYKQNSSYTFVHAVYIRYKYGSTTPIYYRHVAKHIHCTPIVI